MLINGMALLICTCLKQTRFSGLINLNEKGEAKCFPLF